ncbi:MAG: hypothetical protein JXP73_00425 [Deltaproteobacteria bacterium]|nr:hypothetical protein [Deltaproteobacteria bacterium]
MGKRRKIPAGKSGAVAPPDPDALANETLALILGSVRDDADVRIRRVRQRHPEIDEALAAALIARCLQAKADGYAIVAQTLALGESQPQAAGRILEAHPWMDLRNVETLCVHGFMAHR